MKPEYRAMLKAIRQLPWEFGEQVNLLTLGLVSYTKCMICGHPGSPLCGISIKNNLRGLDEELVWGYLLREIMNSHKSKSDLTFSCIEIFKTLYQIQVRHVENTRKLNDAHEICRIKGKGKVFQRNPGSHQENCFCPYCIIVDKSMSEILLIEGNREIIELYMEHYFEEYPD